MPLTTRHASARCNVCEELVSTLTENAPLTLCQVTHLRIPQPPGILTTQWFIVQLSAYKYSIRHPKRLRNRLFELMASTLHQDQSLLLSVVEAVKTTTNRPPAFQINIERLAVQCAKLGMSIEPPIPIQRIPPTTSLDAQVSATSTDVPSV
jgi:hypothetical protein